MRIYLLGIADAVVLDTTDLMESVERVREIVRLGVGLPPCSRSKNISSEADVNADSL